MKKIIKKIIIYFLYCSGINWLVGKFSKNKIFCVGYHSIWSSETNELLSKKLYANISLSVYEFEKQLRFLKENGHTFVTLGGLQNAVTLGLPKPTVVFFDDGFKDVLVHALPVLQKLSIPATLFITTGFVDQTHFLWTLGLRYFLFQSGSGVPEIEREVAMFKKIPMFERNRRIGELFARGNFVLDPSDFNVFLNWQEVEFLSLNNFEIGSHGISHEKLIELSPEEVKTELAGSKMILEKHIGKPVTTVSYPYGRYNDSVTQEAKISDYVFGMCTKEGTNSKNDIRTSPLTLKKIAPLDGESMIDFKVRLYSNFF